MNTNRQIKEIIVTISALTAYGIVFLCIIGTILFLLFGVLSAWNFFYELLT